MDMSCLDDEQKAYVSAMYKEISVAWIAGFGGGALGDSGSV